ncbi:MAG: class II aldolase/adducin family protein [Pseudomonadota bacterium]
MQGEDTLRETLITAYARIVAMGLTDQASGNVSVRVPDGMLVSCSGATAENLTPERVVKVHPDGSFSGAHRPSSEWRMHQAIYERHEAANAVVHTHSDYCVALACHNQPLPGFHYMVGTLGGPDVPCVPYATFGTERLALDAAAALTDRVACLLANHGAIARGDDLDSAIARVERLEILCRHYVLARQLGEPDLLSDADWEAFFKQADQTAYRRLF